MTPLTLSNSEARRLWLSANALNNALSSKPVKTETVSTKLAPLAIAERTVQTLGFVQLDPLRPFARAHEHILWTRSNRFRPRHFERLIEERKVFEHFGHDACILPMQTWPYWQRQLQRKAARMEKGSWGTALPSATVRQQVFARIEREGVLCARDFDTPTKKKTDAWTKPPHKIALDWLWMSGQLAVDHRRGFIKHYDLTERVIPAQVLNTTIDDVTQRDWLCRQALHRLGAATPGQLQRFWDALTPAEVKTWMAQHPEAWQEIRVTESDGREKSAIAPRDIEERLDALPRSTNRLRIVNPFDPVARDRQRVEKWFGFDFRIEIYVPANKRRFGYYTCPILEGARFTGRIELRAEREHDRLDIKGLWFEPGVAFGQGRQDRLQAELARIARLVNVSSVGELPAV